MPIADPMVSLNELQKAIRRGMPTRPTEAGTTIRLVVDKPAGVHRYSYAKIEHGRVKSIAILVHHEPINGIPCFNLGYAVPDAYRNRGWAKDILEKAIEEMRRGLGRNGGTSFYVEAVVSRDNIPSQHVASKVISGSPVEGIDSESGEPILAYTRLIVC